MSDSTNHIDQLVEAQEGKEEQANENFAAGAQGMRFGRRATSIGLNWYYYGGRTYVNGTATDVPDSSFRGLVSLTDNSTNYIEVDRAGTVSKNTTAFSADKAPLYKVVTAGGTVTSYEDHRDPMVLARLFFAQATQAMGGADKTLTLAQALCHSIELTGSSGSLLNVIVPAVRRQWTVFANTSGGGGIRVKTASGSGVTVADGKRCIVECDGTDVVRVTADT